MGTECITHHVGVAFEKHDVHDFVRPANRAPIAHRSGGKASGVQATCESCDVVLMLLTLARLMRRL